VTPHQITGVVSRSRLKKVAHHCCTVAYRGILFGEGSTNSVEDRANGDLGGGSPLVRGSGGSCNLVQEISFHMVKFFLIFGTLVYL